MARYFRARCPGCAWRGRIYVATTAGDDAYGRQLPEATDAATDAAGHRRGSGER